MFMTVSKPEPGCAVLHQICGCSAEFLQKYVEVADHPAAALI
jgi:hypothetical protein